MYLLINMCIFDVLANEILNDNSLKRYKGYKVYNTD